MNKVTPHFTFMRRAQNSDTHVCSSFVLATASDMHLESESEKLAKNVDFHTAENIQVQPILFRYF